jgi:tetratricopeptide (TPR) repeat protein
MTTWRERLADLSSVKRLIADAEAEGAHYGPVLLQHPPGDWRRLMRADAHYRSYGTLQYLLETARERWEEEPTFAHQITSTVIAFVDQVSGPSHIHEVSLRGLARKEYANTCEAAGDLREALGAAERAVAIYGEARALAFEETRARLVLCKVLRELGETDRAIVIARECAAVFEEYGDVSYANMARMFEAGVLFASKRFTEARELWGTVMANAEARGDRLTVARCLTNAAQCARELGDLKYAREFYRRSLAHFDNLKAPGDANCARWGLALTLAASGRPRHALSELFKVRAVFLSLGTNSRAASAALDIVRIKFDLSEDIRDLARELVPLFTAAGLTQSAIEALAYLREQAHLGNLTPAKITGVRKYFEELGRRPALLFVPPRDEDER